MLVVRLDAVVISFHVKILVHATVPVSMVVPVPPLIQNTVPWTTSQKILNCLSWNHLNLITKAWISDSHGPLETMEALIQNNTRFEMQVSMYHMNSIWTDVACVNSCSKVRITVTAQWSCVSWTKHYFPGNLHLVGGDNFSSSNIDDVILQRRHFQIQADQKKMIQVNGSYKWPI